MSVHQSCTNVRIRPLLSYYLLNVPQIFQTINNHGRAKISALLRVQEYMIYVWFGKRLGRVQFQQPPERRRLATLGSSLATTFCGGHQVGPGPARLQ